MRSERVWYLDQCKLRRPSCSSGHKCSVERAVIGDRMSSPRRSIVTVFGHGGGPSGSKGENEYMDLKDESWCTWRNVRRVGHISRGSVDTLVVDLIIALPHGTTEANIGWATTSLRLGSGWTGNERATPYESLGSLVSAVRCFPRLFEIRTINRSDPRGSETERTEKLGSVTPSTWTVKTRAWL